MQLENCEYAIENRHKRTTCAWKTTETKTNALRKLTVAGQCEYATGKLWICNWKSTKTKQNALAKQQTRTQMRYENDKNKDERARNTTTTTTTNSSLKKRQTTKINALGKNKKETESAHSHPPAFNHQDEGKLLSKHYQRSIPCSPKPCWQYFSSILD